MREPIREIEDLRMIAAMFPRCDNPVTVTEHIQTCLFDVAIRAAKRLESAEDDLYRSELYIEKLRSMLGITKTPMAAVMDLDVEALHGQLKTSQEALQAIISGEQDTSSEEALMPIQYSAENLLEAVGIARTAFECLCHSLVSVLSKEAE